MKRIITSFILLITLMSFGQQEKIVKKTYTTQHVSQSPVVDGNLSDLVWQNAGIATDFVMFSPGAGTQLADSKKTEVKVIYDNKAIYVAAYLYDNNPSKIPMEFTTRDNFGQVDFFLISFSPMNDGVNAFEFAVMATGTQADMIVTSSGEDKSWNAVWESKVSMQHDGWIVEMKIPYSALRFSNDKKQTWGMNIYRNFSGAKEKYSWNFIDRKKDQILQYDGVLEGIENIEPPVRLSFYPYASASTTKYNGTTDNVWSVGMDLKYGINDSFTLDATLIPDFGQTKFDDVTLNLGPFEQRFSEKRAFFTEGVDLFSKADFFYSRRVGNSPIGLDFSITANEEIIENPSTVKLFNALKLSGRTKKGLGIGVFNAITQKTNAVVKNTITGEIREVETEPLANYNVLVLDKQFNKNSSVTLINTNVIRSGHFRDANVTGLLYDIKTKDNKYGVNGGVAMSNIYENNTTTSDFEGAFNLGKMSGNHQYKIEMNFQGKDYDKNDLGFQRRSNTLNFSGNYSYRTFKPTGNFNNYRFYLWTDLNYLLASDKASVSYIEKPNNYVGTNIGTSFMATTKKHFSFGGNLHTDIGTQYNYDEPRAAGRFVRENPVIGTKLWFSTDYRKKFALDGGLYKSTKFTEYSSYTSFNIAPLMRLNNKTSIRYTYNQSNGVRLQGYVTLDGSNIIFGKRDVKTITNSISSKYNFSIKSALTLSFRHFWTQVNYRDAYYNLNNDGTLSDSTYRENNDINYNAWNVDLNYVWEFAPGSQLILFYSNSIFDVNNQSQLNFSNNLNDLFKQPARNTLSLKFTYYLDYNKMRKG